MSVNETNKSTYRSPLIPRYLIFFFFAVRQAIHVRDVGFEGYGCREGVEGRADGAGRSGQGERARLQEEHEELQFGDRVQRRHRTVCRRDRSGQVESNAIIEFLR